MAIDKRSKGQKIKGKGRLTEGLPMARSCGSGMDADGSPVIAGVGDMVKEGRGVAASLLEPSPSCLRFCSNDRSRPERNRAPMSFGRHR
jgi:hypothetical protein